MTSVVYISSITLATLTCFTSLALFLWSQTYLSLTSLITSSSTIVLSYALSFLVMIHYEKTQRTTFKICCCNIFNTCMIILYALVVISFLLTFCSIVYIFVQDTMIQYILYTTYGFIFLLIIIGSLGVAFAQKTEFEPIDINGYRNPNTQ